jgi:hypothetical protein
VLANWLLWTRSSSDLESPAATSDAELPRYTAATDFKLQEVADAETLYKLVDILVRHKHLELQEQQQQQQGSGLGRGEGEGEGKRLAVARGALDREAAESLRVTDVSGLYKDIEKLCVLRKAVSETAAANTTSSTTGLGVAGGGEAKTNTKTAVLVSVARDVQAKLLSHHCPQPFNKSSSFSFFGDNSAASRELFERAVSARCDRDSPPAVRGHRAISLLVQDSSGELTQDSLSVLEGELREKLQYVIQPLQGEEQQQQFLSEHRHATLMDTMQQSLSFALTYSFIPLVGCISYLVIHNK